MAVAVPLIAVAAGSAVAGIGTFGFATTAFGLLPWSAAAGFVNSAAGFVVSTAINQLGARAFASKPKTPDLGSLSSTSSVIQRSSIEPRKIVYGQARISGPRTFVHTIDSAPNSQGQIVSGTNKFLYLTIPLTGHEVASIGDIYLNEEVATIDGNGWVTSAPYGQTQTTTTVSTKTVTGASYDPATGKVTITVSGAHDYLVGESVKFNAISPIPNGQAFTITDVPTSSTFKFTYGTPLYGIGAESRARVERTTQTTVSYLRITKHLGTEDQAADTNFVNELPGKWTSDHRGRGVAYLAVRAEWNPDAFPLGFPNIAAVVNGKKVYDPREVSHDPDDASTWEWSDNSVLCTRDYLLNSCRVVNTRFDDDDYTIAQANISDESVTLIDGSSQKRYTTNGVIDVSVSRRENLNALVSAMAGEVVRIGAKVRIMAGAYEASGVTITEDDLAGDVSGEFSTKREELINTVRGLYVDPTRQWQVTEFPQVTNPTYVANDNGKEWVKDLQLPFVNHREAAQRIAKIIMEKARQGIKPSTVPLNLKALQVACGDTVALDLSLPGWSGKEFKVRRFNMGNVPIGPITLSLQEESSSSYDWNAGEATIEDDAPNTSLPNPLFVEPPGVPAIAETLYETNEGSGLKTRATVTCGASTDAFLKDYQFEYKASFDTDYIKLPKTQLPQQIIDDLADGYYDFRVRAFNTLDKASDYAYLLGYEIQGLRAPPSDLTGLTIQKLSSMALLRWDQHPDIDVRQGGRIMTRHSTAASGSASWEESVSIGDPDGVPGDQIFTQLPLKAGSYLLRPKDSTGNYSDSASIIDSDGATALEFANVDTVTESPGFSGTHDGTVAVDDGLQLEGAGLFDDIPDFDAISSIDAYGGVSTEGVYTFDSGIDLGSVQRVQVQSEIEASTFNANDLFDDRTGNIDSWTDFDGDLGGGTCDAFMEARSTNDDPSGTPTWSEWERCDSSEYNARAFQFRAQLTSSDPAYNISVTTLKAHVNAIT